MGLQPEKNVKLTKTDLSKLKKRMKIGWKATVNIPQYELIPSQDIINPDDVRFKLVNSNTRKKRGVIRIVEEGVHIEKGTVNGKTLKIPWISIVSAQNGEFRGNIKITLSDGGIIEFNTYTSHKSMQIRDFLIYYINKKRLESS